MFKSVQTSTKTAATRYGIMYNSRSMIKYVLLNQFTTQSVRNYHDVEPAAFKLSKALLVTKLSRLEFERHRFCHLNHNEVEKLIRNRGTDYDAMLQFHIIHKEFERKIADCFREVGVQVQLANRLLLDKEKIDWADILIPIGGDGTFLLTAGRASPMCLSSPEQKKPVVGFNSDPDRSEGRLMLPKHNSHDPKEAVYKMKNGMFKWIRRSRIKITLFGERADTAQPIDLHEHHFDPIIPTTATPPHTINSSKRYANTKTVIPYLALNEVFIGEKLSARVSHLQIKKDQEELITKTKSSGLCVSTGTGSTSWLTSINRLSSQNVETLLEIVADHNNNVKSIDPEKICEEYNKKLIFPPDDPRLCYSIREQICVGVWPKPKGFPSRGFATNLWIKSRCIDASLVIDGSIAYPFNDGARVLLEVNPRDSLLTIAI